ncbi:MAG TPA: hypothetical protein VFO79_10625, partial [Xanthomonadales bacterium]|nr:hypothetical protein [Xanthomonadales bacterium]
MLALLFTTGVAAQQPAPLPAPNLGLYAGASATAMAPTPDGGMIVAGTFTSVFDPVTQLNIPRRNLARFTASGALDTGWDPSPNGSVDVVAVAADGSVFISGAFNQVGGMFKTNMAKLSANGTVDATWRTNFAAGDVKALAVDEAFVYIGGSFLTQDHDDLLRVSRGGAGSIDTTWLPQVVGSVTALALGADNSLYVGGGFTDGFSDRGIAKVSRTTGGFINWFPGPNPPSVGSIAVGPDGSVYVAGGFTTIGGRTRAGLAKLSGSDGAADFIWNPNPVPASSVTKVAVDATGRVYATGSFTSIGGQPRNFAARLIGTAGTADSGWTPSIDAAPRALALDESGDPHVAGAFRFVNGNMALGYARLETNGALAQSPSVQVDAAITTLATGPDGSAYVSGNFARVETFERVGLFKLGADGSIDPQWSPRVLGSVSVIAVDAANSV